jgi:DNA-binding response OmpR family regulator
MTQKILIIDDEQEIGLLLSTRLKHLNHIVETAVDGKDGLAKAAAMHPDIVLLDVIMPEMSGWKVCRELKSRDGQSPPCVIMMTAAATADIDQRVMSCGADDLLRKPFMTKDLVECIAEHSIDEE